MDFRPVLHNKAALRYILAYGGHCWELFAFRSWLPTYLLFATRASRAGSELLISRCAMAVVAVGVPASIVGSESVRPETRNRLIRRFQLASIALCLGSVISAGVSFWLCLVALLVYNITIAGDSGALAAGVLVKTRPNEQGATLALYSLTGFLCAALAPLAVGRALDLGGGFNNTLSWYLGSAVMGAGSAFAAVMMSVKNDRQSVPSEYRLQSRSGSKRGSED